MMYWDNAATTWPKPRIVMESMDRALSVYGGNPGRGGHSMSMAAAREIYKCRESVASLFHMDNPANVVFTLNCTMSLNIVLKGILRNGGRVVVSDLEHNAVMRPLHALSPRRPLYDVAVVTPENDDLTVAAFARCITPQTRALVCTHASNVFGVQLPIRRLGELAHKHALLFVVDAAQTAGVLPLDMQADGIDFLCTAGHKGLYGPMGTGLLLCADRYLLPTFVEGGTGSQSLLLDQPEELPERLESGTPNTAGICGLRAGVEWVRARGVEYIAQKELSLMTAVFHHLENYSKIRLYTPCPQWGKAAPVLSFTVEGHPSEEVASALNKQGMAVRAGLHCAPAAHRHFGTLPAGTVRLAPSLFTTRNDAEKACKIILQYTQNPLQ